MKADKTVLVASGNQIFAFLDEPILVAESTHHVRKIACWDGAIVYGGNDHLIRQIGFGKEQAPLWRPVARAEKEITDILETSDGRELYCGGKCVRERGRGQGKGLLWGPLAEFGDYADVLFEDEGGVLCGVGNEIHELGRGLVGRGSDRVSCFARQKNRVFYGAGNQVHEMYAGDGPLWDVMAEYGSHVNVLTPLREALLMGGGGNDVLKVYPGKSLTPERVTCAQGYVNAILPVDDGFLVGSADKTVSRVTEEHQSTVFKGPGIVYDLALVPTSALEQAGVI